MGDTHPQEAHLPHIIDFEPVGRRGPCPEGGSLLEAARELGVELINLCGGTGTCGRCKVQILEGQVSPLTDVETERLTEVELLQGLRLACQTYPQSDVKVSVPSESLSTPQRTQVEGQEVAVPVEPLVRCYGVEVAPPSLDNLAADDMRLAVALSEQHGQVCQTVDPGVQRLLSPLLRAHRWQVNVCLRNGECVAAHPATSRPLGLSVDLGTTKVAGYLLDLQTGRTLASKGIMNLQIAYGEDVIARISRALESPAEAERMQRLAVQAIQGLADDLTAEMDATPGDIVDSVVVGNTAMHHLLLRLPVEQLVLAPYVPAVSRALDLKARDLGLSLAAGAYVHLLPNIAGYVGADHVAMILGTELWRAQDTVLALDIGTNTEICLAHRGQLSSVSCASGPAFEGAHITHGMRAANGAIERLRLVEDRVEYHTVGHSVPAGLCGSGILDALAQLYLAGVVDRGGRMHAHERVRSPDGHKEFVLVDPAARNGAAAITITQRDVRELQLAKGAMRTGIHALLQAQNLTDQEIDEVIIAGAFGSYIDVASAITIGMLPAIPLERFRQVGNAAGTGARLALISREQREIATETAARVRYIELASLSNFAELFAESTYLGKYHVATSQ